MAPQYHHLQSPFFQLNPLPKVNYAQCNQKKITALLSKHKHVTRILRHVNGEAIIELCATSDEVGKLLGALEPFGVKELMRTGRVAIV